MRTKEELFDLFQKHIVKTQYGKSIDSNYDDEILNWISTNDMEDEGYDEDEWFDYYISHFNGEAESVVIDDIVFSFEKETSLTLSEEEKEYLIEIIVDKYDFLRYSGCI